MLTKFDDVAMRHRKGEAVSFDDLEDLTVYGWLLCDSKKEELARIVKHTLEQAKVVSGKRKTAPVVAKGSAANAGTGYKKHKNNMSQSSEVLDFFA